MVSELINNNHYLGLPKRAGRYSLFCFSILNIEQEILNVEVFISEEI